MTDTPTKPRSASSPPPSTPVQTAAERLGSRDLVTAALSGLGMLVLLLLMRPITGGPMNDDFSYAHTALELARTGRLIYNGWGTPLMIPQAAIGALIIKACGFFYAPLEWFGVICAALATGVLYLTSRACGLRLGWSLFVTATVTVNAIFLSNAPSFLTDVPSLLLLLLAFWTLVKSLVVDSETGTVTGIEVRRLALATFLGVIAGANRQICWVAFAGALVALLLYVPVKAARLRLMLATGVVIAAAGTGALWFQMQPYSIPSNFTPGLITMVAYPNAIFVFVHKFLMIFNVQLWPLVAPAAAGVLAKRRPIRVLTLAGLAVICGLPLVSALGTKFMSMISDSYGVTIYGQYFTQAGALVGGVRGFIDQPKVMTPSAIIFLAVAGVIAAVLGGYLLMDLVEQNSTKNRSEAGISFTAAVGAAAAAMTVCQVVVSIPWYAQLNAFDRYMLLMSPGLLIFYALRAQELLPLIPARLAMAARIVGAASFAALALWGVGTASEYFNYSRTRIALVNDLVANGVPPENIDAGFETNADTEVRLQGHMNNQLIANPPGAYQEPARPNYVSYESKNYPALDAWYALSTEESPNPSELVPEPVRVLSFTSPILPPHERKMFVYPVNRPLQPGESHPPVLRATGATVANP